MSFPIRDKNKSYSEKEYKEKRRKAKELQDDKEDYKEKK